jgi:hypothetical protein
MTLDEIKAQQFKTVEEIQAWLKEMQIYGYQINDDLTVDTSVVEIANKGLKFLPVNFRSTARFDCSGNELISLIGAPQKVQGDFNCSENKLTNLVGGPLIVICDYDCSNNQLTSLMGSPEKVVNFNCSHNKLTTLENGPQAMPGDYDCSNNQLSSLKYIPSKLLNIICSHNHLTSLKNGSQIVEGHYCCDNNNLISLEGCPKKIGLGLICHNNPLSNLENGPQIINGSLNISHTLIKKINKNLQFFNIVHTINHQLEALSHFENQYVAKEDKLILNLNYEDFKKTEEMIENILNEKDKLTHLISKKLQSKKIKM